MYLLVPNVEQKEDNSLTAGQPVSLLSPHAAIVSCFNNNIVHYYLPNTKILSCCNFRCLATLGSYCF